MPPVSYGEVSPEPLEKGALSGLVIGEGAASYDAISSPHRPVETTRSLHEELVGLRPLEAELSLRIGRGLGELKRPACLREIGCSSLGDLARE